MKIRFAAIAIVFVMSGCGGTESSGSAEDPSLTGDPSAGDESLLHEQSLDSGPYISSLSPQVVAAGDILTINGSNLSGTGTVWLENVICSIRTVSSTKITCQVGAGTPPGDAHVVRNGVPSNYLPYSLRGECVPGHICQ